MQEEFSGQRSQLQAKAKRPEMPSASSPLVIGAASFWAAPDADSALVCREEGSNGDREMAAAMWHAGLEPWDVTMSDLLQGRATLDTFQGTAWAYKEHARKQLA